MRRQTCFSKVGIQSGFSPCGPAKPVEREFEAPKFFVQLLGTSPTHHNKVRGSKRIFLAVAFLFFGLLPASHAQDLRSKAAVPYYLSVLEASESSVPDKKNALDSLCKHALLTQDTAAFLGFLDRKAELYAYYANSFEAYATRKAILQGCHTFRGQDSVIDALSRKASLEVGSAAWQTGFWEEALDLTYAFLKNHPDAKAPELARLHSDIGIINMMYLHNMPEAYRYHKQAIRYVEESREELAPDHRIRIFNGIAGWFFLKKEYDSALYYLARIDLHDTHKVSPLRLSIYYNNLSLIHGAIGNMEIANHYLREALDIIQNNPDSYILPFLLRNMGGTYEDQGDFPEARRYYAQALETARQNEDMENEWKSASALGRIYQKTGKKELAHEYLLYAYAKKDTLMAQQNQQHMVLLGKDFEIYKLQKQQELVEQQFLLQKARNDKKTIILCVLGGMMLVLLVISIVMIIRLFRKDQIHQQKQDDIEKKEQSFQEELRRNNSDMAATNLFSIQKDELLKTLKQICTKLLKEPLDERQRQQALQEMLHLIKAGYYGNSWDEFRIRFELSHPDFYPKLLAAHPSLTKNEKDLCTLLALNMNTKEIASLTQKSARSIETYIYRIRKKINLDPAIKTNAYFHDFLTRTQQPSKSSSEEAEQPKEKE